MAGLSRLIVSDVCDCDWNRHLTSARVIFHLAAFVHRRPRSELDRKELWRINCEGTQRIAEACRATGALLVYASTVAVYGNGSRTSPDDETRPCPTTEYGKSKLVAEEFIRSLPGLSYVVLRFPLLVGPHGRGNMERLVAAISRRRYWPVDSRGTEKSWLSTDDAAAALLAADVAHARGNTFVVSRPVPDSLDAIQQAAYRATDRVRPRPALPVGVAKVAAFVADGFSRAVGRTPVAADALRTLTGSAIYDGSRFASVMGFTPVDDLDDALRRTAAWQRGRR
ncbi:UDP-galactose-4-epimerase [Anaeromyxobacter oryzae]|uniref:UDP-galactose-4-epimerase n=1 Tax=Anaeromyxobacter oryzae TaxID=2918170 RepID=A0ABM7WVA3_9BACT|nr:UDP-galactose-4-epimerase [Anaeromyxobacter oryzae]